MKDKIKVVTKIQFVCGFIFKTKFWNRASRQVVKRIQAKYVIIVLL